jgi:plasmid stabilization system protein ParE
MRDAAASFNQKVRDKIDKLSQNRTVGRKSANGRTILFVLVGKHHKMYYRKIGLTIRIVCFFDTRQNPKNSPY